MTAMQSPAATSSRSLLELCKIKFRNTPDSKRNDFMKFLEASYAPAMKRAGVEAMGFFNNDIGPDKPHVLCLFSYSSGDAMMAVREKISADKD